MKKVILSLVMMMSLMSFSKIDKTITNEEATTVSPECWEFADSYIAALPLNIPLRYETLYNIWSDAYDVCEATSDFDEFQFPN
jgi:hypothetical protein